MVTWMDTIQIKAERRTLGSKGVLNQLRREGKVPAALTDHGGKSLHLTLTSTEIKRAIGSAAGLNTLLMLQFDDGEQQLAMFEHIERDPMKPGTYVHINLTRISMEGSIDIKVPIVLAGQDKRAASNGMVAQLLHELAVTTSPNSIPEHFVIDVSAMLPGDSVCVKDLPMPEGCVASADPEDMVVHITMPKGMEEAVVEEEAAVEV